MLCYNVLCCAVSCFTVACALCCDHFFFLEHSLIVCFCLCIHLPFLFSPLCLSLLLFLSPFRIPLSHVLILHSTALHFVHFIPPSSSLFFSTSHIYLPFISFDYFQGYSQSVLQYALVPAPSLGLGTHKERYPPLDRI